MDLNKVSFNVPISSTQKSRLQTAATLESQRRGEKVTPTALFREVGMAGIDRILAENATESQDTRQGDQT